MEPTTPNLAKAVYADEANEERRRFILWLNRHGYVMCRWRKGIRQWTPALDSLYKVIEEYRAEPKEEQP